MSVTFSTRLATNSPADVFSIRDIFDSSHQQHIPGSVNQVLKHLMLSPVAIGIVSIVISCLWYLLSVSVWSTVIGFILFVILLYAMLYHMSYSGWKKMLKEVAEEKDFRNGVLEQLLQQDKQTSTNFAMLLIANPNPNPNPNPNRNHNKSVTDTTDTTTHAQPTIVGSASCYWDETALQYCSPHLTSYLSSSSLSGSGSTATSASESTSARAVVTRVGVRPGWQGSGGGKLLLRALELESRARGMKELWLTTSSVQRGAVRLYEGMGFELKHKIQDTPGLPFYVLVYQKNLE